ncbi:unnamed protein product, partial [Prorocentrum cordatum]
GEAGANIWSHGASKLEGFTGAADSVRSAAGNVHPRAARHEHVSLTEEKTVHEEAVEKSQVVPNLEAGREENRQTAHAVESEAGLGQGRTDGSTAKHGAHVVRSPESRSSSFAEGATVQHSAETDVADQFLDFIEWWSSNAAQPVSVEWSPVGEARAATYRCGQRVIDLAHVTKEVAEKMLKLTNDLGFFFVSLPQATRIAKGLLQEMVRQDGLIDTLEKGDLESLGGFASYAQAANYARMMYNEVQKQKAALTLPLQYGESMAKTVQEIGALIGAPQPAAPPPILEQVRGMSKEGQAALSRAQPHLAGLQGVVSTLGMPSLGVEIGNVNGELGKLEVQFQHAERHAEKLQSKTTGGLMLHGLGVIADKIQGSGLSPEDQISKKLAEIGKNMAIYTRNLLRMYFDFEKKLVTYKDQFVQAVNGVLHIFTQLGVQVADFFNQLARAQLDSAQQMLSPTCQCELVHL